MRISTEYRWLKKQKFLTNGDKNVVTISAWSKMEQMEETYCDCCQVLNCWPVSMTRVWEEEMEEEDDDDWQNLSAKRRQPTKVCCSVSDQTHGKNGSNAQTQLHFWQRERAGGLHGGWWQQLLHAKCIFCASKMCSQSTFVHRKMKKRREIRTNGQFSRHPLSPGCHANLRKFLPCTRKPIQRGPSSYRWAQSQKTIFSNNSSSKSDCKIRTLLRKRRFTSIWSKKLICWECRTNSGLRQCDMRKPGGERFIQINGKAWGIVCSFQQSSRLITN